jgi:multiple sugar transport system substrate-binding protein
MIHHRSRLLATLLIAFSLIGIVSAVPAHAQDKTKIVFWTNDRHDQTFMKAQIDEYNQSNADNIAVDYVINTENYPQLLELAWQSKQAPDLLVTRPLNLGKLVGAGYIEPLDSYLSADMKDLIGTGNFVEGMDVYNGKLYSLPLYGSTFRLVYNTDLFKRAGIAQPPTTLAEMVSDAKKITEAGKADDAYGFAINLKTPSNAWNRSLMPIANLSGFSIYDYKAGQFDFTKVKPILQAFKQMVDDGSMFPSYQSLDIDPLRSQFAAGKIGMYLSISAEAGVYSTQFKPVMEWAAAQVPAVDANATGKNLIGRSDWLAMSGQSANKAAAAKVIAWLYRKEFLVGYHEQGYGISVLPQVLAVAKTPTLAGIQYFMPTNRDANWPVYPNITKVDGKDYNAVFAEYVFGVSTDLDGMMTDLSTRYNAALAASGSKPIVIADFDASKLPGAALSSAQAGVAATAVATAAN